jgi:hypothetical protein
LDANPGLLLFLLCLHLLPKDALRTGSNISGFPFEMKTSKYTLKSADFLKNESAFQGSTKLVFSVTIGLGPLQSSASSPRAHAAPKIDPKVLGTCKKVQKLISNVEYLLVISKEQMY